MFEDNEVITFNQALEDTAGSPRVLLLGNGFSQAYFVSGENKDNNPFSWKSLGVSLDARVPGEHFKKLRERLREGERDVDVEFMVRKLQQAAEVAGCYDLKFSNPSGKETVEIEFKGDAKKLKDGLVLAIADNHPREPNLERLSKCVSFLNHFIPEGGSGSVFTLSYDQLLNWASMANRIPGEDEHNGLNKDDGFRKEGRFVGIDPIKLHYLHGALHLWSESEGDVTVKSSRKSRAEPLVTVVQMKLADSANESLTVVGGTVAEKLKEINKSTYLKLMRDRFKKELGDDNASLFVYGVSFDKNDNHIFEAVRNSRVKSIYISTTKLEPKPEMQDKVALIKASRARDPEAPELTVHFFDAASAHPWGD